MQSYNIWTDGSCLSPGGAGGAAAVIRPEEEPEQYSLVQEGFQGTTNQRMEMMAACLALEALIEPCEVTLTTDSKYVQKGITEWIHNWMRNGWRNSANKPVANQDLWVRLLKAATPHQVTWVHIRGHRGDPDNEACDRMAGYAARSNPETVDVGYQKGLK